VIVEPAGTHKADAVTLEPVPMVMTARDAPVKFTFDIVVAVAQEAMTVTTPDTFVFVTLFALHVVVP
jgi:hypothetical protein